MTCPTELTTSGCRLFKVGLHRLKLWNGVADWPAANPLHTETIQTVVERLDLVGLLRPEVGFFPPIRIKVHISEVLVERLEHDLETSRAHKVEQLRHLIHISSVENRGQHNPR